MCLRKTDNKTCKYQNSWIKKRDLAVGPFTRSSSVAIIQVQVCHFCREWTRCVGEVSVRDKADEADHAVIIPGDDQIGVTRSVRVAVTELADFADKPGEKLNFKTKSMRKGILHTFMHIKMKWKSSI